MKKLIALILASLCLVTLASCSPVVPGYATTVAYVGWSDDPMIADGALRDVQHARDVIRESFPIKVFMPEK